MRRIVTWLRGVYQQTVVLEQLSNTTVQSLASPLYNEETKPTSSDMSTSGGGRNFGAMPSQGDWFAPPPNPPANQSVKR